MTRNRTRFLQLAVMALVFWGVRASAQDTGASGTDLELYRPAIDSFGVFGVNRPEMFRAGRFHLAVSQDLATGHLFRATINRQDLDVVDRIATTDFLGAVGVNDFITASLDLPVHLYMKGANINTGQEFTSRSLGDIRAGLKFRLLEEKKEGLRPGFALLFTNTFPTGNERNFLGTSHAVPAADLIFGKDLKGIGLALNVGGRFPQQKNILGQDFNDQVTYGLGARMPLGFWDRLFSLMGEIRGHFEPGDIETVTSPIEFTLGFLKEFQNGLAVRGGGGTAWNNAIGNPRMRGILIISYQGSFEKPPPSAIQKAEIERLMELKKRLADEAEREKEEQRVRELQKEIEALEKELEQKEARQEEPEVVKQEVDTEERLAERERIRELEGQIQALEQSHREIKRHLGETERQMKLEKKLAAQKEKEREKQRARELQKETETLEKEGQQKETRQEEPEVVKKEVDTEERLAERERIRELEGQIQALEQSHRETERHLAETERQMKLEKKLAAQKEKEREEQRARELQKEIETLEKEGQQKETRQEEPEVVKAEKVEKEPQPVQEKEPWVLWLPGFDLSPLERSLWTTVYFSTGASRLPPESRKWVDEVAQAIRQGTAVVAKIVMIQGHTDAIGAEEVNRRLSLDRAKRVKEMLLARGVSEKLIQLEAHSFKHPVASNDSKAGRSLNRRAELIVILSE